MNTSTAQLAQTATRTRSANAALVPATIFNFFELALNPFILGFAIILPMFMYFMFGVNTEYSGYDLENGNVSAQILVSMVTYGVLTSLSSQGVNVALERANGWVRQIALTPLGMAGWTVSKILASLGVGALIVIVCYVVGGLAEAEMTPKAWIGTGVMALLAASMASPLGLAAAFWIRSDGAFALVGGGSSLLAFASGMFIPLEGMGKFMQTIAPYMPFYGVNRVPLGFLFGVDQIEAWDVISLVAWFAIFTTLAIWGAKRRVDR